MNRAIMAATLACLFGGCIVVTDDTCGDGFLDFDEACDDGNLFSGDGCSAVCTIESGPLAGTYDECTFDSDCADTIDFCQGLSSSTVATGICTRTCSDMLDCPVTASGFEPLCASIDGASFLCFETCSTSSDCAAGFNCEVLDGTVEQICVPR